MKTTTAKRARDLGRVRLLQAEVDPRLDDAIEDFARDDRRTKRVVVIQALEEFLAKRNRWPREAQAEGDE